MSKPEPLRFDTYYHIYNRGNNGEIIFRQKRNYLYFLQLYIKHMHPIADTYSYCLMSNHFHTDGYFMNLVTYIHRNPQQHGFVDDFRDWPYSSYNAILLEKPTRVQRAAVLEWFGGLDNFLAEHKQAPDETLITHLIGNDK